ncbi:MAG: histidine kinase [Bacteroidales bacterium]|nr:histidine kinase [Bacteroidales bacterium]
MPIKSKPKDFIFEGPSPKSFHYREVVIRFLTILFLSVLSPLVFFGYDFRSDEYLGLFIISLLRTIALWHGSMLIINYWTTRYSIFEQPIRLLAAQFLTLALFVYLVAEGEIMSMKWFTGIELPFATKMELIITTQLITFLISSIYASVGFFMQWKQNLIRAQSLEKATIEAQYESLKNQVNPHFLFNSLNTLLSIVEGNANAERYIENLSEFMRYILKNRERQGVSLKEELEVAAQYSFLQQSRFPRRLMISFEVSEVYHEKMIPPLTLQMLIENAIKHNEISNENTLNIKVFVDGLNNLVVENTLKRKIDSEPSTGIGLKNIRDRYLILLGKQIIIQEDQNKFSVLLPLS